MGVGSDVEVAVGLGVRVAVGSGVEVAVGSEVGTTVNTGGVSRVQAINATMVNTSAAHTTAQKRKEFIRLESQLSMVAIGRRERERQQYMSTCPAATRKDT